MFLPTSTYRLQLNKDFTFDDVEKIIDYLVSLGITTIYAAPFFAATPGSNHGYDVIDPHKINPEIGTEAQFAKIIERLKENNISWVQDIVPNHMAFTSLNKRLYDVMERGIHSDYHYYFDINWNHPDELLNGRLMAPFLGKELSDCVLDGEFEIEFGDDGFIVNYSGNPYPLSSSAFEILANYFSGIGEGAIPKINARLSHFHAEASSSIPLSEWQHAKDDWLASFTEEEKSAVAELLTVVNNDKAFLEKLLQSQYYLLCYWRISEKKMNYRRFFTVNSLICLSMEDERVFSEYHKYILHLYKSGLIQGVRIDHIDGLQDPRGYVDMLRDLLGDDCYIVAEKILEAEEILPADWKLQGTSGYEFLAHVSQLLTNRDGASQILDTYNQFIGENMDYHAMVYSKKLYILREQMQGEFQNLLHYLDELEILNGGRTASDCVGSALESFMAAFPVYRVYPETLPLDDMESINDAFELAEKNSPGLEEQFETLKQVFNGDHISTEEADKRITFIKRLMQFTGPLAAKGVEDTTFYIYNPLISHCEVGDAPSLLGTSIDDFHKKMQLRMNNHPASMNATATHDTKRGEDARMRINAITEIPDEWKAELNYWHQANASLISTISNAPVPSLNEEYFIYQALAGGYPEGGEIDENFINRFNDYYVKVLREAKEHTNWAEPDSAYEDACTSFVKEILTSSPAFLDRFHPFVKKLTEKGARYSLSQALIKMTSPGIPDIYQGSELWDLSFVDPDNRRDVDYKFRQTKLTELKSMQKDPQRLVKYVNENSQSGMQKLYLTWKVLNFRKTNAELFSVGSYIPVETGTDLVIAYLRRFENSVCLVIAPIMKQYEKGGNRISIQIPEGYPQHWKELFTDAEINTDGSLELSEHLDRFPVLLLSTTIQS